MNTTLLIQFIILNIVNVIIQTVKSIVTVKCGKELASLVNAIAFGLYTVVTVYMMCELPLGTKALIVALCNLVGVYVVKYFEEKARKDKLWKIELTVPKGGNIELLKEDLRNQDIPFNYIENIGKYTLFNIYCATQEQSKLVKDYTANLDCKYFVSESKIL
jgi:uncharacterized protein YebE (UPF0316 family)